MDDRRISSTTRHSGAELANTQFSLVKRGFDPNEVRVYLERLGNELSMMERRLQDAQAQLSDAHHRAANPVLDEAQLASMISEQGKAILRAAHEEANRLAALGQERATQIFTQAQERSSGYLMEAQTRSSEIIAEAERMAMQLEQSAREAAMKIEQIADANAAAVLEQARDQGRAIVEQAQQARREVLNDLAVKRKALNVQIEQLRAARDVLTTSVNAVRESVEHVLGGLMSSDEGARAAAIAALRSKSTTPEPSEDEVLRNVPLRVVPDVQLLTPDGSLRTEMAPRPSAVTPRTPATTLGSTQKPSAAVVSTTNDVESLSDNDEDPVSEIFAKLRAKTQEEKGIEAPVAKRAPRERAASNTPDDDYFARRQALLDVHVTELTRNVKRALQDDQNVMLEKLRDVRGNDAVVLEDEMDQRARYASAAVSVLRDAGRAGAEFAKELGRAKGSLHSMALVDECAADLAATIAVALRKRVMNDGAERASNAYRDWRGARVERLCTDMAMRAFNVGVVAACDGGNVRFVVAPNDAPCDACATDAAAGERPAGAPFPSGQANPPLHAGCGCLVVPQ